MNTDYRYSFGFLGSKNGSSSCRVPLMTQGILDLRCGSMYLANGKGDADAPIDLLYGNGSLKTEFFSAGQMGPG